jgi:hypothetical protein
MKMLAHAIPEIFTPAEYRASLGESDLAVPD